MRLIIDRDVPVEMRDGTVLRADVYRPDSHETLLLPHDAPVRLFIMGTNVWREEQEWPLARTQYTHYYLHSRGKANSLHGDGGLMSPEAPGMEPPDRFLYDPRHPRTNAWWGTMLLAGCAAAGCI